MKIKVIIPTPDDSNRTLKSSFLFKSSRDLQNTNARWMLKKSRRNKYGEIELVVNRPTISNIRRRKLGIDPVLENIKTILSEAFLNPRRGWADSDTDWISYFGWKYDGQDVLLTLSKMNGLFYLNNNKKNKEDATAALAKIIYFGTTNRSADSLSDYIYKNVIYPQNIIYALENRTPYYFYDAGIKIDCRLNLQLVNDNEIAIEVSDGIWGSMKVKDANIFINSYRNNSTRSKKWSNLSPRKLWKAVMGSEPTDSELNLMLAWLKQNRTGKMVEDRATVLLKQMVEKYDDLLLLDAKKVHSTGVLKSSISEKYDFSLLVRGKLGDWIVYANGNQSQHQRVSAVFFEDNNSISGPYCIDNLHDNSSIGDQIASRAMILKNDNKIGDMIYTLKNVKATSYRIPEETIALMVIV